MEKKVTAVVVFLGVTILGSGPRVVADDSTYQCKVADSASTCGDDANRFFVKVGCGNPSALDCGGTVNTALSCMYKKKDHHEPQFYTAGSIVTRPSDPVMVVCNSKTIEGCRKETIKRGNLHLNDGDKLGPCSSNAVTLYSCQVDSQTCTFARDRNVLHNVDESDSNYLDRKYSCPDGADEIFLSYDMSQVLYYRVNGKKPADSVPLPAPQNIAAVVCKLHPQSSDSDSGNQRNQSGSTLTPQKQQ